MYARGRFWPHPIMTLTVAMFICMFMLERANEWWGEVSSQGEREFNVTWNIDLIGWWIPFLTCWSLEEWRSINRGRETGGVGDKEQERSRCRSGRRVCECLPWGSGAFPMFNVNLTTDIPELQCFFVFVSTWLMQKMIRLRHMQIPTTPITWLESVVWAHWLEYCATFNLDWRTVLSAVIGIYESE